MLSPGSSDHEAVNFGPSDFITLFPMNTATGQRAASKQDHRSKEKMDTPQHNVPALHCVAVIAALARPPENAEEEELLQVLSSDVNEAYTDRYLSSPRRYDVGHGHEHKEPQERPKTTIWSVLCSGTWFFCLRDPARIGYNLLPAGARTSGYRYLWPPGRIVTGREATDDRKSLVF